MPQDWRPGLKQADCVSVELRAKNQWSEKYAAVMRDGSEYWLDRVTSMIKTALGNGEGLLWWRSDMALVGAYEAIAEKAVVLDSTIQNFGLSKKAEDWAVTQLGEGSVKHDSSIKLECTRRQLVGLLHGARMRYKTVSDKACELGTRAHALIELWLKNKGNLDYDMGTGEILEYDIEAEEPEVRNAFEAFKKWFATAELTHERSELLLHDLETGVAGRLDHMLRDKSGRLGIIDIKTSKGFYAEMLLQVAGYAGMAAKCGHGLASFAHIVRVDKITAECSVMPVFEDGETFRRLYAQFRDVVRTARFVQWAESYTGKFNRKAAK